MNYDFKFHLTLGVTLFSVAVCILSITGVISLGWILPSILAIAGSGTLMHYFSIPAAEEKQKALAEYGRQLLEQEGYEFEKNDE